MRASVIIPTFRRSSEVVENTLRSILSDEQAMGALEQIVLIDQNFPHLELPAVQGHPGYLRVNAQEIEPQDAKKVSRGAKLIHIYGIPPSVTRAKNFGSKFVTGEVLVFFDDDVTVQRGCIGEYLKIFSERPEIAYLGGRETIDGPSKNESTLKSVLRKLSQLKQEPEYQVNGIYIGRIKPNSFMIKNFDVDTDRLVKIDGARGCNWACRAEWFFNARGFDEHYQGTALREETDLYLRLNRMGGTGHFASKARVIHHRQLGGCENLSASVTSLISKFENELYFQKKHFARKPGIFFMIRMLPLMADSLIESKGFSFFLWLFYGLRM